MYKRVGCTANRADNVSCSTYMALPIDTRHTIKRRDQTLPVIDAHPTLFASPATAPLASSRDTSPVWPRSAASIRAVSSGCSGL